MNRKIFIYLLFNVFFFSSNRCMLLSKFSNSLKIGQNLLVQSILLRNSSVVRGFSKQSRQLLNIRKNYDIPVALKKAKMLAVSNILQNLKQDFNKSFHVDHLRIKENGKIEYEFDQTVYEEDLYQLEAIQEEYIKLFMLAKINKTQYVIFSNSIEALHRSFVTNPESFHFFISVLSYCENNRFLDNNLGRDFGPENDKLFSDIELGAQRKFILDYFNLFGKYPDIKIWDKLTLKF